MRFYIDKQKIKKYSSSVHKVWSVDTPYSTPTPTPTIALTLNKYKIFKNVYDACNGVSEAGEIDVYSTHHPVANNEYLYSNSNSTTYKKSYFEDNFGGIPYYIKNTSDTVLRVEFDEEEPELDAYVIEDDCIVCPAPWMKILLSDGTQIPAGELKEGMFVKTYHEKTMELGDYKVLNTRIFYSNRVLIKFKNLDFVCSESHKFYVNGDWIEAKDLKKGSFVGKNRIIEKKKYEYGEVVSISVIDAHTYICENFLSHNKTPPLPTPTVTSLPTSLLSTEVLDIIP